MTFVTLRGDTDGAGHHLRWLGVLKLSADGLVHICPGTLWSSTAASHCGPHMRQCFILACVVLVWPLPPSVFLLPTKPLPAHFSLPCGLCTNGSSSLFLLSTSFLLLNPPGFRVTSRAQEASPTICLGFPAILSSLGTWAVSASAGYSVPSAACANRWRGGASALWSLGGFGWTCTFSFSCCPVFTQGQHVFVPWLVQQGSVAV